MAPPGSTNPVIEKPRTGHAEPPHGHAEPPYGHGELPHGHGAMPAGRQELVEPSCSEPLESSEDGFSSCEPTPESTDQFSADQNQCAAPAVDSAVQTANRARLFGVCHPDSNAVPYRLADVSRGELPSEAEIIDPDKDGWLAEGEFRIGSGITYGEGTTSDPRFDSSGFRMFRAVVAKALENPELARKRLGKKSHLTEPAAPERKDAIPDRDRLRFYQEANSLFASVRSGSNPDYPSTREKLLKAASLYKRLRHTTQADACYRLLYQLATNAGKREDATYARAEIALGQKDWGALRRAVTELPHDHPDVGRLRRALAWGTYERKKDSIRVEDYAVRTPEGRFAFTQKFTALPPKERAKILAEISSELVPELSGIEGDLESYFAGFRKETIEFLKAQIRQTEGNERAYHEAKLVLVEGDSVRAHQLYTALRDKLAPTDPLRARCEADFRDIESLHARTLALQLLQIDLFVSERMVREEEPDSDERKEAQARQAFIVRAIGYVEAGRAATLKDAVMLAFRDDAKGYHLWRSFSDLNYYQAYNCASSLEAGTPLPRFVDIFDAAGKLGLKSADEIWFQKADFLYTHGDFEGVRIILEQLLDEPFADAIKRLSPADNKAIDEKFGYEFKRDVERALYEQSEELREEIVKQLKAQGITVAEDDPLVDTKLAEIIGQNVSIYVEDQKSFARHKRAFKNLRNINELQKLAAGVYENSFDPHEKWWQPTEEGRRRLFSQAVLSIPLILFGGYTAAIARAFVVGGTRAAIGIYVGETALDLGAVRAGIYTAGLLAGGYTFHTTTSLLSTPFIGARAWDHYWSEGFKASLMFGVLDGAKGLFKLGSQFAVKKGAPLLGVEAEALLKAQITRGTLWAGELTTEVVALSSYSKLVSMAEGGLPVDESFMETCAHNLLMILELRAAGTAAKPIVQSLLKREVAKPIEEKRIPSVNKMKRTPLTDEQADKLADIGSEFQAELDEIKARKEELTNQELMNRVSELYEKTVRALARLVIPEEDFDDIAVLMFGSASRREVNWESDCDVMIIVRNRADLRRFRQYIVDMMEAAEEIDFKMERHLTVMAVEGDVLVPARWGSRRLIPKNVKDALISPSQMTSLRLIDGDQGIFDQFYREIVKPVIEDPAFIAYKYEEHVLRDKTVDQLNKVLDPDQHEAQIPLKSGIQRMLNCIAWIAASRFGTDVSSTQEGIDLLRSKGMIGEGDHMALSRLLRAAKFLRLHGQFDDTGSSEWTNREGVREIVDSYDCHEMPGVLRAEFEIIFGAGQGKKITVDAIIEQLLQDTMLARTVADRIRPSSVKIQDVAIRAMPRWVQEQTLRVRLWHLKGRCDTLKTSLEEDLKAGKISKRKFEKNLESLDELVTIFAEVLQAVENGTALTDSSFRQLLFFAPRLIDSLSRSDLTGDKPTDLVYMLVTKPQSSGVTP